jgi:hypothetical protein
METLINVTEYQDFQTAWEAATTTKEEFAAFQTGSKINLMKQYGKRFFVSDDKELWYTTMLENLRSIHKADVTSCLSNGAYEFVQILVPNTGIGTLRFTESYVDREQAINLSGMAEPLVFYKA